MEKRREKTLDVEGHWGLFEKIFKMHHESEKQMEILKIFCLIIFMMNLVFVNVIENFI